jgi:hypothetical protein
MGNRQCLPPKMPFGYLLEKRVVGDFVTYETASDNQSLVGRGIDNSLNRLEFLFPIGCVIASRLIVTRQPSSLRSEKA